MSIAPLYLWVVGFSPLVRSRAYREREAILKAEQGVILLLVMVFMLLLGMVATTVLSTASLELRMASNDQLQEEAYQQARGIASELSQKPEHFPVTGGVGFTACAVGDKSEGCDDFILAVLLSAKVPDGVQLSYRIVRLGPLVTKGFPIRESQSGASSAGSVNAALFEIDVQIDGSGQGLGSARVVRGIAVPLWAAPPL
ncbi:MAG: hypothetical protein ACI9JM_002020 [Halioglobus sp.]